VLEFHSEPVVAKGLDGRRVVFGSTEQPLEEVHGMLLEVQKELEGIVIGNLSSTVGTAVEVQPLRL